MKTSICNFSHDNGKDIDPLYMTQNGHLEGLQSFAVQQSEESMEILQFLSTTVFTFFLSITVYKLQNLHRLFALLNGKTLKLSPKMAVLTSSARRLYLFRYHVRSYRLKSLYREKYSTVKLLLTSNQESVSQLQGVLIYKRVMDLRISVYFQYVMCKECITITYLEMSMAVTAAGE